MPSRRSVLGAGATAGFATVAGCLGSNHSFGALETDANSWRQSRYDLHNTAANIDATVPDDPDERWRFEPKSPVRAVNGLVVGEDVVLAGSERAASTSLVALDRDTGERLWAADDEAASVDSLALGDERVYTASTERAVTAYDRETGEQQWVDDGQSSARTVGATVLFDGDIVYRGDYHRLTAYDATSGDELWELSGYGGCAIADGQLFRGSGRLAAYHPADSWFSLGSENPPENQWEVRGNGTGHPPVVWNDLVLSSTRDGPLSDSERLQAYAAADGALEWELEYQDAHIIPPAIVGERAVFHAGRGDWSDSDEPSKLVAIDSEGAIDWEIETAWEMPTLVAAGETVFVGGENDAPALAAIDPETGETRWEREVRGEGVRLAGTASLAAVDGLLVVGTEHGQVVAYD
ncbi:PQQ repeat protein [Natrialba magadii ATCC 43099]|uniref:PQQ repeat protein n=1 Tax=Natrialba magadii (strain ATCC 43099 / DSM 3394 / CCM 3739 / CIP 104546 / IAM 13178 / JCM 8861 / NBRC 102185 / NCIMB 2190 / MS3) TaxID=547559 RepID=D3SVN1_NATMM|nr:PQQ-binding-like beta-propeller repeat protein [Natrialba magadii]ADD05639.1 PQQ repeat protein [Natrialba magadii ATCC 43099]ELY29948.1 pyrrolo-quinoline quinone [Natrialba magadii ATCC 43099]